MKHISRREFLRLCAGSAAALGISQMFLPEIAQAFGNAAAGNPPVLWVQGASCSGCSVSLLNTVHPDIKEVLLDIINLHYHPNLMAASGDLGREVMHEIAAKHQGKFYLVVEGAVPTKDDGLYCTVGEDSSGKPVPFGNLVRDLGEKAAAILAVGTCAAYGGLPAGDPNPTGCVGVKEIVKTTPVINIPGCPPHPDWIVGTLAHVLMYREVPKLDRFGRPEVFFSGIIHDNCPRRQYFDNSILAEKFGDPGCLLLLGCKGPITSADCPTRLWNNGRNWCIKAGAPCLGCTEPGFPDKMSPVYQKMPDIKLPGISANADLLGEIAGVATAAGIGAHLIGNIVTGRIGGKHEKKDGDK